MMRMAGTLYQELCMFMIIPRWIISIMRYFSDKISEKIKTFSIQ
jgi:hypothetical protein